MNSTFFNPSSEAADCGVTPARIATPNASKLSFGPRINASEINPRITEAAWTVA